MQRNTLPHDHMYAPVRGVSPPRVVHLELHTGDLGAASAFYGELLQWRTEQIDTRWGIDDDAIVAMLTQSATAAMPPASTWFRGRDAFVTGLRVAALNGSMSWRLLPTSASGQLALGAYLLDSSGAYLPNHLAVLALSGDKIDQLNAFHDPTAPERFGLPDHA